MVAEATIQLPADGVGKKLRAVSGLTGLAADILQQIGTLATVDGTLVGHKEDAAHASGDGGIMALGVRNDALAALTGTDGDYSPLAVDLVGRLLVDTELPVGAALSDAMANPSTPGVGAHPLVWNGSSWARARDANTAPSTGTGVPAAGLMLHSASGSGFEKGKAVNDSNDGTANTFGALVAQARGAGFNGTNWDRLRVPVLVKSATATASGDTALWTPTSGKKFRLMRVMLGISSDAATAGGARITMKLRDATTDTGVSVQVFVPAVASTAAFVTPWIDLGNGILSSTANNVLNVNLSAALTGGAAFVIAAGVEE